LPFALLKVKVSWRLENITLVLIHSLQHPMLNFVHLRLQKSKV